jgi:type IV pilus assembly protein PilC
MDIFSFIPLREKVAFTKNLGAMLSAGLPLSRALEVLSRQSSSKPFQKIITGLGDEVRKGHTLSQSLLQFPRVFPPIFSALVAAGEEGGSLSASLASLTEQLERSYALGRKIIGALIYPALIILVMIIIAILILVYVVPELSSTFKEFGVDLPISTQILVSTSEFISGHFVLFVSLTILIIASLAIFFRTRIGRRILDWCVLRIPIFKTISMELNSARTARSLGSLLGGGVPIISSLRVVSNVVQNSFYKDMLVEACERVEKGDSLSEALTDGHKLYEPYFTEMVASGEETGKLSEMLRDSAEFYEAAVEQKTKNLSSVVEPFLMVAVGVAAGFFAYSMILPMYTLMQNV